VPKIAEILVGWKVLVLAISRPVLPSDYNNPRDEDFISIPDQRRGIMCGMGLYSRFCLPYRAVQKQGDELPGASPRAIKCRAFSPAKQSGLRLS